MIIGIGNDIIAIDRIAAMLARHGERFMQRVFTAGEQETARSRPALIAETYAKRWAAKEACAKALGTGFSHGIRWRDIEVTASPMGAPLLTLHGRAAERLANLTPAGTTPRLHLSLSDDSGLAQAFVVIDC